MLTPTRVANELWWVPSSHPSVLGVRQRGRPYKEALAAKLEGLVERAAESRSLEGLAQLVQERLGVNPGPDLGAIVTAVLYSPQMSLLLAELEGGKPAPQEVAEEAAKTADQVSFHDLLAALPSDSHLSED